MRTHTLALCSLLFSAGAVVSPAPAVSQDAPRVGSEAIWPESIKHHEAVRWMAPAATSQAFAELVLSALPNERFEALKRDNQTGRTGSALQIGIERDLAGDTMFRSDLHWQSTADGHVAQLEVTSPGAAALRVAVSAAGLPEGTQLRYAGSLDPDDIEIADLNQMRNHTDDLGRFWTGTTSGDRQHLEWFIPNGSSKAFAIPHVAGISHLFVDPIQPGAHGKALGDALACNRDVACHTSELGAPFVAAKNSVAQYIFQGCIGHAVCMCSGALLNDTDPSTQRKWFYTGWHCIDSQTKANTMDTIWNYEASSCGAGNAGPNIRITGGADVMKMHVPSDASLLELRGTLPASAHFVGWDANELTFGERVVAIHHPRGDSKKISLGMYTGREAVGGLFSSASSVAWTQGTTEGASSGSGIFTLSNGSYHLRGSAIDGTGTCSGYGSYGRFDLAYPSFKEFLGEEVSGGSHDYTGAWYSPSEDGRGLTLFESPDGGMFGLWFVYDSQGRAAWYELESIWTDNDVLGGRVVRWTGAPWAPTYNPGARSHAVAGTYTLRFTSASAATLNHNVDGVQRQINLVKML